MVKTYKSKSKEERLEEICNLINNAENPISIKELKEATGLERSTLMGYLKILENLNEICKSKEESANRLKRHLEEEIHPFRGRSRNLYTPVTVKKKTK